MGKTNSLLICHQHFRYISFEFISFDFVVFLLAIAVHSPNVCSHGYSMHILHFFSFYGWVLGVCRCCVSVVPTGCFFVVACGYERCMRDVSDFGVNCTLQFGMQCRDIQCQQFPLISFFQTYCPLLSLSFIISVFPYFILRV